MLKCGQVKKRVGPGISNFFFLKCRGGELVDVKNNFQNKKMFFFHEKFSILVSEVNFNDFGKCLIFSNFFLLKAFLSFFRRFFRTQHKKTVPEKNKIYKKL